MVVFGNDTVTLFNRVWDDENETETWLATVLIKCNLVATKGRNISKSGLENADTVKLYVDTAEQAHEYVKPKEYESLADKSNIYTFTPQIDFIVKGDVSTETSLDEGFFEYMLNKYDDVYRVTTVDEYTEVMAHLEVGGK